ncbi:hypothetical protein MN086_07030 [Sulfurovum sp. XGS-02]|uniref:hypothetical protein n=1 Tax=Sulfurovum sp. XGS-02 TaxID=2925411 RepID=UPI0020568EAC|nr:hypothetical protein [Sulfurovum sp. XGS-02]UPT76806.1 hypothetical protein MN086_07030 [Sulfurovum sp. XGS-02]
MYLNKTTLGIFMVMLVTLFTGCGGGSGTSSIEAEDYYTDYTIYTDRIIDTNQKAIPNLRVDAISDNWVRTDLSTDENGEFEIEVIPGEKFTLQVYDSDKNTYATYSGKITVDAAGDIVSL